MRRVLTGVRTFLLPQGLILVVAVLLMCCAVWPQHAAPIVAARSARQFIMPNQSRYQVPSISQLALQNKIHREHKAAQPPEQGVLGAQFKPAVDCASRPCIALSFDDGPNAITTPRVLDALEQKHVTATFFLIGRNIAGNENLVRRMAADNFEIGNHTWDHPHLPTLPPDLINDEVSRTQTAIAATGAPLPTLLRPPYGDINLAVIQNIGLQVALWNEDPRDWQATNPVVLTAAVVAAARPGGVIDFHDTHAITADVLPGIIDQLSQQNYQFVTVSDLLHSRDRPGNAPFYGYAVTP